jgi:hypothetical protein
VPADDLDERGRQKVSSGQTWNRQKRTLLCALKSKYGLIRRLKQARLPPPDILVVHLFDIISMKRLLQIRKSI